MVQRVTYKRRHGYNTRSNKIKIVKTPGHKLVVQYRHKQAAGPKCGDCGTSLPGIKHMRPIEYSRVTKREKTVARTYGGVRCGKCVRTRILRAFLVEEQRIVKKVIKTQKKKKAAQ